MPKKNIPSLKSVPSLHGSDVAEYSENGLKYNIWNVLQWVTQSVIRIPLWRMPNFIHV